MFSKDLIISSKHRNFFYKIFRLSGTIQIGPSKKIAKSVEREKKKNIYTLSSYLFNVIFKKYRQSYYRTRFFIHENRQKLRKNKIIYCKNT